MCGIGGIVGGPWRADERESAALRLRAALRHRGPDGDGLFSRDDVALVHTRLAILDPTPDGNQPMRRGPLTLVFNGEIYNHRPLRDELGSHGEIFSTSTDSEVLLALYARRGMGCLKLLRGMFAFAVWDERDRSCFLARDSFGIKPLYYTCDGSGGLLFASELRALLATDLVAREIDPSGLDGYLSSGSVPEPHTLIRGVKCLPAGQTLHWRVGAAIVADAVTLDFTCSAAGDSGAATPDLRATLADSVEHHLISDVPVGLLLSGGLDSAALLALAQGRPERSITTFSLGVEDPALDESSDARAIAHHFHAPHHEMLLTRELARRWVPDFLDSIDQPTIDGFNTYCACKLAADHGCKVVLSGLGADELFGGYPSFLAVPRLRQAGRALGMLRPLAQRLESLPAGPAFSRLAHFAGGEPSLHRAYDTYRAVFTPVEIADIRRALSLEGDADPKSAPPCRFDAVADPACAVAELETTRYLRNQLLRDADVMGMAHGVEVRVPFLDLPLFHALRRVPARERFAPNKSLLRASVPGLSPALVARRKRGFSLPFAAWLDDDWDDLGGTPPSLRPAMAPWYRRWAMVVLLHWLRRMGVRTS